MEEPILPPELVAAADQDYAMMRTALDAFVLDEDIREQHATRSASEVYGILCITLSTQIEHNAAAALAAAALVEVLNERFGSESAELDAALAALAEGADG